MQDCNMKDRPKCCKQTVFVEAPAAMAYVPWQEFHETYPLCKALQLGTVFPELCKPFCGRRGCK